MFLGRCCVPWVSGEVVLFGNQAVPEVTRAAPVFGLSSRGLEGPKQVGQVGKFSVVPAYRVI
jgi:hypothetical protein